MRPTAVSGSKTFSALPARRIPSHPQLLIKIYEISLFFLLQLALAMLQLSKNWKIYDNAALPCERRLKMVHSCDRIHILLLSSTLFT